MTLAGIRHASELAEALGVRPQTVNAWMHRERVHIDSYHLLDAAERLHVSVPWLLHGKGCITPPRTLSPTHTRLIQRFDALSQKAQAALLAQLACQSILQQSTT